MEERIFVKTITRELTLFTFEIWHKAQQNAFSTALLEPSIAEETGRYDIFAGSGGLLSSYVDKNLFLTANKLIKKRIDEDNNFFPGVFNECDKYLKILKKIWKKGILKNRDELLSFFHLNVAVWPAMTYALYLPSLKFIPKPLKKLAWKYRTTGDILADASDRVIRNTLLRLYPHLDRLAYFLSLNEIRNNQIPRINELKKREEWCFLYDGSIYTEDLQKFFKKNNIKLSKDIINAGMKEFGGTVAFRGLAKGFAKIITKREQIFSFRKDDVLVAIMTTPDYIPAMKKAAAFVTDEGGITCHAAIISREMKKPCITGTKIATTVLKDGDFVEVDAYKGVVKILKR